MLDPDGFSLPSVPLIGYVWFLDELMSFHQVIVQAEAKALYEALSDLWGILSKLEDRARNWNFMRPHEYSDLSTEFATALSSAREERKFRVASAKAERRINEFLLNSKEAVTLRFEKMREAADFLRTLGNEARSKGEEAGDRATSGEIRKALSILHRLGQGEPMKVIAQVSNDGLVDDGETLKKYKSLERMVSRFSKRVARAVQEEYGSRMVSLGYNHLFHALRDWPGIDRRRDRIALMEAARRGLPNLRLA
jgi:hypothetical protein